MNARCGLCHDTGHYYVAGSNEKRICCHPNVARAEFIATTEHITADEARLVYDMTGERLPDVISVCDGEWRKLSDRRYVFWRNPERFE